MSIFITILIAALLLILVIRLFKKPIRFLFKLLFNTILGYIALILINHFGMYIGLSLPITLLSAVIVGFLGLPGVIILLLVYIFL
jgi:inhibitor of the pro-sigma K processing machinery